MNQNPSFDWSPGPVSAPFDGIARHAQVHGNALDTCLVWAMVALAPVNLLRVNAFYFTASDAAALAVLSLMIVNRSLAISPLGPGTFLWNAGLAAMIALLMASGLGFGDPIRSFTVCAQYLFAYFLMSFVLVSRPKRQIEMLAKALVYSIAVMCLFGIYVVDFAGQNLTTFVSGNGRYLGFVERENECASLIALSVPLVLWLGFSKALPWYAAVPLVLLDAYGIMLTGSNTGLLALVYAVACFLLIAISWRQAIMATICAALMFFSLTTWGRDFTPLTFQTRVLGALQTGELDEAGTFTGRVNLIYEALGLADNSIALGIGPDSYREVSKYGAPVHNTYLLVWVEGGFFAMMGFIVMLIGGLVPGIVAFRMRAGRLAGICTLTGVSLFALLINALPHMYGRFFVVPLLLAIAPSVNFINSCRQNA